MASAASALKVAPHNSAKNNQKCGSKPPVLAAEARVAAGKNRMVNAAREQTTAMANNKPLAILFPRSAMGEAYAAARAATVISLADTSQCNAIGRRAKPEAVPLILAVVQIFVSRVDANFLVQLLRRFVSLEFK